MLKHSELTEKIIGVFYDVYNTLGHGFLESVYENAMVIALADAGLKCEAQVPLAVQFRDQMVGDFRIDILVEELIVLELKAVREMNEAHVSQTINYLKASKLEVGLLLNFGPSAQFKRLVP